MGRWKKLRALEAAARTGDAMARAEIARAAREQATTQSVLNAIQSLTKTGAGAALQGYDVLTSGMAEQALAGGPGIEDVEVPDFTQDPLGAMSSFIQNLPRGTAREKASRMAAERAPQAFAQKLPLVAKKVEEDWDLDPALVASDVLSQDPVISRLPEQQREAMSAQAAQQVLDDRLRRQREQETYDLNRALNLKKLQPEAEKLDSGQMADVIATNLQPRAVELRDQLSAPDNPKKFDEAFHKMKQQVEQDLPEGIDPNSTIGKQITSMAIKELLKGVKKKPIANEISQSLAEELTIYNQLSNLDKLRKDANFSPSIIEELKQYFAENLKTPIIDTGQLVDLKRELENRVNLTSAQMTYVKEVLDVRFNLSQSKVVGTPSDRDMKLVLQSALSPWVTDEAWRTDFQQKLANAANAFNTKVETLNSFSAVPQTIISGKEKLVRFADEVTKDLEEVPPSDVPRGNVKDVQKMIGEEISSAAGIAGGALGEALSGALDGVTGKPREKAKKQRIIVELNGERRLFTPEKLEQFEKTYNVKLKRLGTVDEPAPAAPTPAPAPAAPTPAAPTPGVKDSSIKIGPDAPNYQEAEEALKLLRGNVRDIQDVEPGGKEHDDPFTGLNLNEEVERAVAKNIFTYDEEYIIQLLQQLLNKTIKDEDAIYLMMEAANE